MQANELDQAIQLACQHSMPAVVVHPQLVAQALVAKGRRRGQFKIITTVDWPRGEVYGMNKLRGMTIDGMQMDGFEIMLTAGRSEAETRNEAKSLTDFIRNHLSPIAEIRFVLGTLMRSEEDVLRICRVMKDVPAPALIRTDHHLKAQVTKANAKTHVALMQKLRTVTAHQLKLSGNIDSVRTIAGCLHVPAASGGGPGASRFAVNLQQAQAIIRDLQQQPDELRRLLEAPPASAE